MGPLIHDMIISGSSDEQTTTHGLDILHLYFTPPGSVTWQMVEVGGRWAGFRPISALFCATLS